jgi:S1-C subfamily serine protease
VWLSIRSGPQTGRILEVAKDRFVIGRDADCDLALVDDDKISRKHAAITAREGRFVVQDLGSTNGTYVDEERIVAPTEIHTGDSIKVGDTLLVTSETRPSGRPTTIGAVPPEIAQPERHTGLTTERILLRKTARRATFLGIAAAVIAIAAVGVVLFFSLTGDDEEPVAAGDEKDPEEIVEEVTPATVNVNTFVDGQPTGGGTGWVLDADDGLIVTNQHVVNAGDELKIGVAGDDELRDASVVGGAPCEDLAVLKIDDNTGLKEFELGSQSELRQGETVVALGFPASVSNANNLSATVGAVSVVNEEFDLRSLDVPQYPNVIRTDAAINPGNSGGPLVTLEEKLVGVNSAGITLLGGRTIQGESFAIGIDRVKSVVAKLRLGQSIGWTGMGLVHPTGPADTATFGLPNQPGLIVSHVTPGTGAEEAGFGEVPALITAINGVSVDNTLPRYCEVVSDISSGDTATFTVVASGSRQAQQVDVTFE